MRRWMMLVTLLAAAAVQTGCGDGMMYSSRERMLRQKRIADIDRKQLVDDWDAFMLNDRPTHASRWRVE